MMMSDLPLDLTEELLCRIPATYLIKLRSTCKIWNALLKNRRFTEKHFHKASRKSHVLMSTLCDTKLYPMKLDLNVVPPSIVFKDELRLNYSHSDNSEQVVGICKVSHCDGLLLCTIMGKSLVVWNPCLGETRWIQLKTDFKNFSRDRFSLGYQNKKSFRSYKILRCCNRDRVVGFETYECSSDLWRVSDDVALDCSIRSCGDVCLKGNPYWLALDETTSNKFLLGFDVTRERIIRLRLPSFLNREDIILSVVREEQLSLLHWNILTSKMEIWVPKGINTEVALWSKYLTVEIHNFPVPFDFESFLIDEEKKVALCCSVSLGVGGLAQETSTRYWRGQSISNRDAFNFKQICNEANDFQVYSKFGSNPARWRQLKIIKLVDTLRTLVLAFADRFVFSSCCCRLTTKHKKQSLFFL